jgi:hypothetical protein
MNENVFLKKHQETTAGMVLKGITDMNSYLFNNGLIIHTSPPLIVVDHINDNTKIINNCKVVLNSCQKDKKNPLLSLQHKYGFPIDCFHSDGIIL